MRLKKIISLILLIIILIGVIYLMIKTDNINKYEDNSKPTVVVTTFSSYDFVRQIAKDKVNLIFLLGPGIDSHGFEPGAQDIIQIENADLFIYVGGTLEPWSSKVVQNLPKEVKTLRLIDSIELLEEVKIDGTIDSHNHVHSENKEIDEREYDEHIWTSLENATKMIDFIESGLSNIDKENESFYKENAENYKNEINGVKNEIQEIVDNSKRKRLVFGDKMSMLYFIEEFGLEVSAAFNGCAEETVPTSSQVAYLVDLINKENIPVVLYIELSNGKVAKTLSEETGAKMMQIQTLHNISKEDFENGETYVSLMKRNAEVLKQALN